MGKWLLLACLAGCSSGGFAGSVDAGADARVDGGRGRDVDGGPLVGPYDDADVAEFDAGQPEPVDAGVDAACEEGTQHCYLNDVETCRAGVWQFTHGCRTAQQPTGGCLCDAPPRACSCH